MSASIELFGSYTSPYVRRVRIVALELGLGVQFVDSTSEAGQLALRGASPLWKVPAARVGGELLFDSAVIGRALLKEHGPGSLAVVELDSVEAANLLTVIDGALDSLINSFYLGKEGVGPEQAPYLGKQRDRAASAMAWLERRVEGPILSEGFGWPAVALSTTLEWMSFRRTCCVEDYPKLVQWLARHSERASLVATRPPA